MAEGAKNRAAKVFKINPKLILCLPSVTSHSPPRLFLTECICAQEMFYYVIQHSWYVQLQNSVITNGFHCFDFAFLQEVLASKSVNRFTNLMSIFQGLQDPRKRATDVWWPDPGKGIWTHI